MHEPGRWPALSAGVVARSGGIGGGTRTKPYNHIPGSDIGHARGQARPLNVLGGRAIAQPLAAGPPREVCAFSSTSQLRARSAWSGTRLCDFGTTAVAPVRWFMSQSGIDRVEICEGSAVALSSTIYASGVVSWHQPAVDVLIVRPVTCGRTRRSDPVPGDVVAGTRAAAIGRLRSTDVRALGALHDLVRGCLQHRQPSVELRLDAHRSSA